MTQKEKVLDYLKRNGTITKYDGFNHLGITKVDTIISYLRKDGYQITGETVRYKNKEGVPTHYTVYSLADESKVG